MVAERTAAASELSKTTAPHGITGQEIKRFDGVVHFMKKHCTGGRQLWWVSVAHGSSREFIDKVWKRITNLQRDNRLPPYRAMTLEAQGGLHAHIVFVGNRNIADRLKGSAALGGAINVGKVYNSAGLAHGYLAKERTPQASFHRPLLGGRIKGSHRLEGGGDRVRLSEPLKHHAIAAGYVQPWARDNAKRKPDRKGYRLRSSGPLARAPRESGQILLFPELSKPVARLQAFGGGWMLAAVAEEAEFRHRLLNLSQRELAALVGLCQGQYANAIRGHDPISARATNRLSDVLLSRGRAYCSENSLDQDQSASFGKSNVSDEAPTS